MILVFFLLNGQFLVDIYSFTFYFSASPEPRISRPPELKYRIGQVIKHKKWGYRGVIVGWDKSAKVSY